MAEIPTTKVEFLKEGIKYVSRLPFYEITHRTGIAFAKPISATIVLTTKCNLHCPFCFVKRNKSGNKLNEKELIYLVNNITQWGIKQISFTGGEPFIEKELLFKLLEHSKNHGATVGIVTNGTLITQKDIETIRKIGVDRISVSIDGPPKIHDQLRGQEAYKKAIKTLRRLGSLSKKNKKPKLRINTLILDQNIKYLKYMFFLAKKFNASLVISPLATDNVDPETVNRLWVRKSRIEKLRNKILELKRLKKIYGILLNPDTFLDLIPVYYKNPAQVPCKCKIFAYHMAFTRMGDVGLCGYFGFLGNIRNQKPQNIWKSKIFEKARKKARKCNRCLLPCQYTPSFFELINDLILH